MKEQKNINPPEWPLKLLRLFVKQEYLEEIEGDMEEIFHDNVHQHSLKKARRKYTWEMLKLFRPGIIGIPEISININHYGMFRNYYKTSFRSLMKNPLTSFINIFGLSIAIGICLVVYAFLEYDYSIDRFHENKDKVYLVTYFGDMDGTAQHYGTTPRPLGEMLREDFAQIRRVCRVEDQSVIIKFEDNVFHEQARFVDPEFLQMFTFPLKWGASGTLADINSIILSEEMAIKYFGAENPIGEEILMKFGKDRTKTFKITGVAEDFPDAHIIEFGFLVHFENLKIREPNYNFADWREFVDATFIQLDNPSDLGNIERGMEKYVTLQNQVQKDRQISSFAFERLADLHLNSKDIVNGISHDYSYEARVSLPIIGLFMLILACFNYINIAIVSASKRLKEIGIRKVIGANRGRVIVQFISENVFVTLFALVLGMALAVTLFLPWFIDIASVQMKLKLIDQNLWIFLVGLLLFTGIASGLYPAFYISKFEATKIFKGSLKFGKKNPLTKVFLGFQIILACILITGAVMYAQNTAFQANRSWGYNQEEVIYATVPDQAAFEQLNAVMAQEPDVVSISGSAHHLGKQIASAVVNFDSRQFEVHRLSVDANYFETMGIQLESGRFFKEHAENDKLAVVVNEQLVKNLAMESPLGQQFEIDTTKFEIIGVVKDVHINSFYQEVHPTIFNVANENDIRYLSIKVRNGSENKTYDALRQQWTKLFPEEPFDGGHQKDLWNWFYIDLDTQVRFSRAIAFVAVLLASLGFYGLVTLNVSGRLREFSIRKILGAELKNLAANITRQYVLLVALALIIGAPLSYVLMKAQIKMLYPDAMPMDFIGVTIAVGILLLVLFSVVAIQIRKVSKANPVIGLKVE